MDDGSAGRHDADAWIHDPPPDGLGLRRRSVAAELYSLIYAASCDGSGTWDASARETGNVLGCASRTVQRAMADLATRGYIYVAANARPHGQRGGRAVNCYAACLRPVREVRARRRDSALAARWLGLPYCREDAEWIEDIAPREARAEGWGACFEGLTNRQADVLRCGMDDGRLSVPDAVTIARLMREAPVPVIDEHMEDVVTAYLEAKDDGFEPEDMLRAERDVGAWMRGEGRGVRIFLYVLLRRNTLGKHHKALVEARKLNHMAARREFSAVDVSDRGQHVACESATQDAGIMTFEETARTLDKLSPRYAGKRLPELADAVRGVQGIVKGGCTGEELVEAYRWYLDNDGALLYALPWLRNTDGCGMDSAWWCVVHLRRGRHR